MKSNEFNRKISASIAEVGAMSLGPKLSKATVDALLPQEVKRFYGWVTKKPETAADQAELDAIVAKIETIGDLNDRGVLIEMRVNHKK